MPKIKNELAHVEIKATMTKTIKKDDAGKTKMKKEDAKDNEDEEKTIQRKPGQKYPCPTSGAGDRVFYETLYRQKPNSRMAQEWCLAHGVLSFEEAKVLYQQLFVNGVKRKGSLSPVRSGNVKMEDNDEYGSTKNKRNNKKIKSVQPQRVTSGAV